MCIRAELARRLHVFWLFFDVSGAASSGWALTYQRILHAVHLLKRLEAIEAGEGALSKLFAGKVHDYSGFSSVSSAATGALASFRNRMFLCPRKLLMRRVWRTSAVT